MLPDLGPHAAFIWTCYAIAAAVLVGLALWLIFDGRRLERQLACPGDEPQEHQHGVGIVRLTGALLRRRKSLLAGHCDAVAARP